jgi:hypothetical protein
VHRTRRALDADPDLGSDAPGPGRELDEARRIAAEPPLVDDAPDPVDGAGRERPLVGIDPNPSPVATTFPRRGRPPSVTHYVSGATSQSHRETRLIDSRQRWLGWKGGYLRRLRDTWSCHRRTRRVAVGGPRMPPGRSPRWQMPPRLSDRSAWNRGPPDSPPGGASLGPDCSRDTPTASGRPHRAGTRSSRHARSDRSAVRGTHGCSRPNAGRCSRPLGS